MDNRYKSIVLPAFFVIDAVLYVSTFLITSYIHFDFNWSLSTTSIYNYLLILSTIYWIISSLIFGTYIESRGMSWRWKWDRLLKAQLLSIICIFLTLFALQSYAYSRYFLFEFIIATTAILTSWHSIRHVIVKKYRAKGRNFKNLMLIGKRDIIDSISKYLTKFPNSGYHLKLKIMEDELKQFGNLNTDSNSLGDMMKFNHIEDLIITMPLQADFNINNLILCADNQGVRTRVATQLDVDISNKHNLFKMNGIAILDVRNEPLRYRRNQFVKRVFDIVVSLFAITFVLSWAIPLIGIVLIYESSGSIIFKQKRVGITGKKFICYKIRSMYYAEKENTQNPEKDFPNITTKPNDNRVTTIGKWLRKSNLDELPQFINVLKGEMSVIGPRPHMIEEDEIIRKNIDRYLVRHYIKPGITGWAGIHGLRGGTKNMDLMQKRIDYDLWYIENWTFWLDLKIFFSTCFSWVSGKLNGY